LRDELNRLLEVTVRDAIDSIRQAITSPDGNFRHLESAAHRLNSTLELKESIDRLVFEYFNSDSKTPH